MLTQKSGLFAFREIQNETELMAVFRLRYDVYCQQTHLRQLLSENEARVDVDGFDVFSRHFGLFHLLEGTEKLVGYLRVIEQQKFPLVEQLLEKLKTGRGLDISPRPYLFYFQKKFPDAEQALQMSLTEKSIEICEPGRFIILPEYRSAGLAQFILKCIMVVLASISYLKLGAIYCQREHISMYLRHGFDCVAEEKSPKIASNPWNLLTVSRAGVARTLPDLQERLLQFQNQGCFYHRLGHFDWQVVHFLPVLFRRWVRRIAA